MPHQAVNATRRRAKIASRWCRIEAKPSRNGGDMMKRTYGVTQLYLYRQDQVRGRQTVNTSRIGLERAFR